VKNKKASWCVGGATRLPPRDQSAEVFLRDPTVGPRPKVGTRNQKWKSSAKISAPKRLRCETIQKEVS